MWFLQPALQPVPDGRLQQEAVAVALPSPWFFNNFFDSRNDERPELQKQRWERWSTKRKHSIAPGSAILRTRHTIGESNSTSNSWWRQPWWVGRSEFKASDGDRERSFMAPEVLWASAIWHCHVLTFRLTTCLEDATCPRSYGLAYAACQWPRPFRLTKWTAEIVPCRSNDPSEPFSYRIENCVKGWWKISTSIKHESRQNDSLCKGYVCVENPKPNIANKQY